VTGTRGTHDGQRRDTEIVRGRGRKEQEMGVRENIDGFSRASDPAQKNCATNDATVLRRARIISTFPKRFSSYFVRRRVLIMNIASLGAYIILLLFR
jgi:hypothetical protein